MVFRPLLFSVLEHPLDSFFCRFEFLSEKCPCLYLSYSHFLSGSFFKPLSAGFHFGSLVPLLLLAGLSWGSGHVLLLFFTPCSS